MAKDFRIARNFDLYGHCKSVVAYRDDIEIGRAVLGVYPKPNWLIGPSGIPNADDFDIELAFDPERTTQAEMLDKVDTMLRFSISAAESFRRAA